MGGTVCQNTEKISKAMANGAINKFTQNDIIIERICSTLALYIENLV